MPRSGITYKVGNRTYTNSSVALRRFALPLDRLSRQLGDLTKPFDDVAGMLIPHIKLRFRSGELGRPPFRENRSRRSRFTKAARRAKGQDPDGPALSASGDLERAVERKSSPTKSATGGQREVMRLVLGVNGSIAPYYRTQLLGGTWQVPVRIGPRGGMHFDPDRLEGSTVSSAQYWGPQRWAQYEQLAEGFKEVQVPATNFFHMTREDDNEIREILLTWLFTSGIKA